MRKWIFILIALNLYLFPSASQRVLKVSTPPLAISPLIAYLLKAVIVDITPKSYFYQQHCNQQLNNKNQDIGCDKEMNSIRPIQFNSSSKREEAHPEDQVFEITLLKHKPHDFLAQQTTSQTQASLLQQVSSLIATAISSLFVTIVVLLFHWRKTRKSRSSTAQKKPNNQF